MESNRDTILEKIVRKGLSGTVVFDRDSEEVKNGLFGF